MTRRELAAPATKRLLLSSSWRPRWVRTRECFFLCDPLRLCVLCVSLFALVLPGAAGRARAFAQGDEEIRPHDRVTLTNGNVIEGVIVSTDAETAASVQLRTAGGATLTLQRSDIGEIVPRQTAADVYERKRRALRALKEPAARARAELALGVWCTAPHAVLAGEPPAQDAALEHLLNAARLDPSLCAAYDHLLAQLDARGDPLALAPADLALDVEVYVLSRSGDCEVPESEYRVGVALAGPLADPAGGRRLLEQVLAGGYENGEHRRRARSLLSSLYCDAGERERAIALYEGIVSEVEGAPENFEPFFELGRLYLDAGDAESEEKARAYFARAQALQPEVVEILAHLAALEYRRGNFTAAETHLKTLLEKHKDDLVATIDLALVRVALGRLDPAEKTLRGLLAQTTGAERARVHLALGSIASARGQGAEAVAQYRQAVALVPESLQGRLLLGFALAEIGESAETRAIATRLREESPENLAVYALASRLLAEAELGAGNGPAALVHFDRALEVSAADPLLLERAGVVSLRQGRLDAGYSLLEKARANTPALSAAATSALGFYHYSRGEMDTADELLRGVARSAVKGHETGFKAYAERARSLIADLESLEVWNAELAGADGADLDGWKETEHHGVAIERRDGRIVFSGTQEEAADGITQASLERGIDARTFQRLALAARVVEGNCRVALRLEGSSRTGATAGVVLLRDTDGVVRFQVKGTSGDWETAEVSDETDPAKGRLVFPGNVAWPDDGKDHELEIRRSSRTARGARSTLFDLYLDGQPVAWNVGVAGLSSPTYEVGISAQAEAAGQRYTVAVSRFGVYRVRPGASSGRKDR